MRAVAFHAGVFRWLAERSLLEQVQQVSSVSGGSLFVGLVFHLSGGSWPDSATYLQKVYPAVQRTLTGTSLQSHALLRLIVDPRRWRHWMSRADMVAISLRDAWDISLTLGDLPPSPVWTINGTTAETGRRFRFKGSNGGDYRLGYADFSDLPLAQALAVSAAFPGGIGPLTIDASTRTWGRHSDAPDNWGRMPTPARLHLYDGGVYDNLGLEPLVDLASQSIKGTGPGSAVVVCSDAGAPWEESELPGPLSWRRMYRIAGIAFEQVRALRVRCFMHMLAESPGSGAYLQIGSVPEDKLAQYAPSRDSVEFPGGWLAREEVSRAAKYATSLRRMRAADFELVSRHGYETARWNSIAFDVP